MIPDPLHQQAEALAKAAVDLVTTMILQEDRPTREILAALRPLAYSAFQRIEAETREEDAKEVEAHMVPEDVLGTPLITFMLKPSIKACNEVLDLVAKSIRARKDRP